MKKAEEKKMQNCAVKLDLIVYYFHPTIHLKQVLDSSHAGNLSHRLPIPFLGILPSLPVLAPRF